MKNLKKLGKVLEKKEQMNVNGGRHPFKKTCCDPALQCCTTTSLAQNNSSCGGTYIAGCKYHPSTDCCI